MRILAAVLLGLFAAAAAQPPGEDADSFVKSLTPETFKDSVGKEAGVLVEFYTPWCAHCKRLAADYEMVGFAFRKSKKVTIAKIDADAHKDFAKTFDVGGYPTLLWYPKGSITPASKYEGARTQKDIIDWINTQADLAVAAKKVASSVVEVATPEEWEAVMADTSKHVVVDLYAPWCGHCKSLAPEWEKLAQTFAHEPEVTVVKVDATLPAMAAVKKEHVTGGFPTVLLFDKEREKIEYEGERKAKELVEFVNDAADTSWVLTGARKRVMGKVPVMAGVVRQFMRMPDGPKRDMVMQQVQGMANHLQNVHDREPAQYYVKVIKKIAKEGNSWVEKEVARLRGKMSSATPDKAMEFKARLNALDDFLVKDEL